MIEILRDDLPEPRQDVGHGRHHSDTVPRSRFSGTSRLSRETVPFREVSEDLLRRIAELGHHTRYRPGERIYSAGDEANDIFVVVSGRIEHVFAPEVGAREALKRLTRGAVFGWAGCCRSDQAPGNLDGDRCIEVVRIDSDELLKALEEGPVEGYAVMERFASMIIHDYPVPEFLARSPAFPASRLPKR